MKRFQFGLLVLTALVWLTCFVTAMVGFIAGFGFREILSPEACAVAFLLAGSIQITWGIFAGTVDYVRGWRSIPSSASMIHNWLGNVAIAGVFAVPGTMFLAGRNYWKKGKFFPTPSEC